MKDIKTGATIWARSTTESDIFFYKPDIWFKIWFYIVTKVNHTDTKLFKRGSGFFNFEEEKSILGCTDDQIKKCMSYFRRTSMLSTKRSTRGTIVTVLQYNLYQDLSTYRSTTKSTSKARRKHETSTPIHNNDNNVTMINIYNKISSLKNPELEQEIRQKYHVSKSDFSTVLENLENYCQANGRKYKDYKAALQQFIRTDIKKGNIIPMSSLEIEMEIASQKPLPKGALEFIKNGI